jgi:hypothetical protein
MHNRAEHPDRDDRHERQRHSRDNGPYGIIEI